MTRSFKKTLLALTLPLALLACGGGDGHSTVAIDAATPAAAVQLLRERAAALTATPAIDPAEAARQLMDYAEATFPQYFPQPAPTQSAPPFAYRYYPGTGIYLGVVLTASAPYTEQGVYVMGGAFGDAPQFVGHLLDFITPVDPRLTLALPDDKAVVQQGASTQVSVNLTRQTGFAGAVQVSVSGLPGGVTADPLTVPADATSATLVLRALGSAAHTLPTPVTVTATSGDAVSTQALTLTVRGAAGSLDTTFGAGVNVTPVDIGEDYAYGGAVQADGKVILAGSSATLTGTQFSLVRYLRDGGLDPSFGQGGKVLIKLGPMGNDIAKAVAVQADGRIVVVGGSEQTATKLDFAVVRLLPDGQLDASFANGGKFTLDFSGDTDRAWALAVQPDGKIVVGGESRLDSDQRFTLIRLTSSGALDPAFGQGGKVVHKLNGTAGGIVRALALQPVDGEQRILAAGGEGDFQLARFKPNGAIDGAFGQGGEINGLFNANIGSAYALALLPNGSAVVAGHIGHRFAAVRLTVGGQLDVTFGNLGRFSHAVVDNWNEATALVRQSDGKLVLGGWAYSGGGSSGDFAAIRLSAGGVLDPSFAQAGVLVVPTAAGTKDDQSHALVLQADERVPTTRAIQAGEANGSNHDFVALRLWL